MKSVEARLAEALFEIRNRTRSSAPVSSRDLGVGMAMDSPEFLSLNFIDDEREDGNDPFDIIARREEELGYALAHH